MHTNHDNTNDLQQSANSGATATDWYERRADLHPEMVFRTTQGDFVKLDRTVPGDGTKWYVADWFITGWAYMDSTIEPGELATLVDSPTTPQD